MTKRQHALESTPKIQKNNLLKDCFNQVYNFEDLNSNQSLDVYMNHSGTIFGNSSSAVMFFAIDYYKSASNENARNKLFILSHDGKLLLRNKKKDKYITTPIHFTDNMLDKYHDFYNRLFFEEEVRKLKLNLAYNGTSYQDCKNFLKTFLKYCLVNPSELDACAFAIIHFIAQVKLKLFGKHDNVIYHCAPVLMNNDQGSGKSAFVRALCKCLKSLFIELNVEQITDDKYSKYMSDKLVVFADDFDKISGKISAIFKYLSTSTVMLARVLRTHDVPTYMNNCTFIFTANTENLGDKIQDETGNRRFMPFLTKTFNEVPFDFQDKEILKPLYCKDAPNFVYPIKPVDKTDLTVLWQNVNENWMLESWYFDEINLLKPVQKKHVAQSTVEQFIERYEIEKSNKWVPTAMIYSIYMREVKNPESLTKFTSTLKKRFGDSSVMPRIINGKNQRCYCISFNSSLNDKVRKEFPSWVEA